jgi:polysaccharide export outer membrane protein
MIEPSVIVRIASRKSARVSVLGEVGSPGIFALNLNNKHLIEVLSEAGGPLSKPRDLIVRVNRRGRVGSIRLERLVKDNRYNIHLQPGDIITVESPKLRYTVLGGSNRNDEYEFNEPNMTLAHALGRAGGLRKRVDQRKDVFVYRETKTRVFRTLGVNTNRFDTDQIPAIYKFDLTRPTALFAAREFQLADGDVIYISDQEQEPINAIYNSVRQAF